MELEDVRSALIKLYGLLQSSEESLLSASSVNPSGQSLAGATDKILEDVDYISKQVADAIKRIKSRLQALRPPAAEVVDPLNEKNPADKGSCRKASNSISIADKVHPAVETKEEIVTRSELSQAGGGSASQAGGGSALSGNVLSSRQISHRLHKFDDTGPANNVASQSQSQKPLRKSNDLLSQLGSQKNGNRGTTTLPGNALNLLMKPTGEGFDLRNQYDAKNVKAIVEKIESLSQLKSDNDRLPSHARNCVHGLRVSPSQVKLGQESTFIAKAPSRVNKENAEQDPMPQNETTGNSTSTPSLIPRSLDPIDLLLPNRKTVRPRHKMNQTQARALNRKNNLPYQVIMRPTLLDCRSSRMNPEKQTGRLRRLKNKLGLVFHHHHHHHHHNHNNDDDSDHAEAAHAMSLWTHMRKIFPHSNKKKVHDDHSVKKSRKRAVVSNVPSKNVEG